MRRAITDSAACSQVISSTRIPLSRKMPLMQLAAPRTGLRQYLRRLASVAALGLAVLGPEPLQAAPQPVPVLDWIFDGPVHASARVDV